MSRPSSAPIRRAPHGRLLFEALVAVVLAAAMLLAVVDIGASALALGDAAVEYDRATVNAERGAAEALRAACGSGAADALTQSSPRHWSDRRKGAFFGPGDVATLRVSDRWQTVGVGRHDTITASVEIGVRCD